MFPGDRTLVQISTEKDALSDDDEQTLEPIGSSHLDKSHEMHALVLGFVEQHSDLPSSSRISRSDLR